MDELSGKDRSISWRDRLISAFEILDVNKDGVVSEAELDRAVVNPTLDPRLAEIVAVLKSEFDGIRKLKPDGLISLTEWGFWPAVLEKAYQRHRKVPSFRSGM